MTPTTPGPIGPGTVIHVTWDLPSSDYELNLVVAACERPSLWRHTVDETDYLTTIEYRFEPVPGGTSVAMHCNVTPVGWYGWISVPMVWLRRGRLYRDQLPQLK